MTAKETTNEQIIESERIASYISGFSKQKQKILVAIANAFMEGLIARSSIDDLDARKDA